MYFLSVRNSWHVCTIILNLIHRVIAQHCYDDMHGSCLTPLPQRGLWIFLARFLILFLVQDEVCCSADRGRQTFLATRFVQTKTDTCYTYRSEKNCTVQILLIIIIMVSKFVCEQYALYIQIFPWRIKNR